MSQGFCLMQTDAPSCRREPESATSPEPGTGTSPRPWSRGGQPTHSPALTLGCFSGWRPEDTHPSGLRWRHCGVLRQPQLHGGRDQTRLSQRGHLPSDGAGGQQSGLWQRRPVLTCNLYVITVVGLWHISNIASFESITQCFRSRSSSPVTFKEMGREDKRAEWENVEGKSGSRAWIILEFVLLQLVLIGLTVPFLGASEPIPPVAGGWRLGRALGLHMFVTFFFFF